ncbi:SDR family oxidoreductase [Novosphingobium sp. Gsoil 351]|uniref:SDR family oxidoreductase n=1 Tax=Novosphingobium sp. Gsoil 351 TaxID=2675225 RepID=UPI001E6096A1|nr:SDR family oxidoreductase [Novosphingobium sp. Gsoil 351]
MRPLALVTGGWRRIGAAIAEALAADGWDLALHAHHPEAFDRDMIARLERGGSRAQGFAGDLADPEFPGRLVDEVAAAFGRAPTLLVNSASIFRDDRLATLTAESLDLHMRTNLTAPLLLTRAFAAALDDGRGSIVMLLDQRVRNPVPDQLSYSLSKQALHASIRNLARDLAPRMRVNGVAPGLVLPTEDYEDAQWARLTALMPLERLAAPADIAAAVVYLARAQAVTGQTIYVDSGANLEAFPRDFVYMGRE